MKRLLAFLALAIVCCAAPPPPTQDELQAKLDSAFQAADFIEASVIGTPSKAGEKMPRDRFWESSDLKEIRSLSGAFRVHFPLPVREVIDGEEVYLYEEIRCGCFGDFQLTLKAKEVELISFTIFHAKRIGSRTLLERSQIEVDEKSLAPFYAAMVTAAKKKMANKIPEPTPDGVAHR